MNKAQPFDTGSSLYQQFLLALPMPARLAWAVGIETGLRVSDILALKKTQLAPEMKVTERKTGKQRTVHLSETLIAILSKNADNARSEYCFPSKKNPERPMHRDTIGQQIEKARRMIGITDQTISMHSTRRMYAIRKYEETGDYKAVQEDLGHKHEGTTLVYIHGARPVR